LTDRGIPIRLFNINNYTGTGQPRTVIGEKGTVKRDVVKSVTFSDDFALLKILGPGVGIKPGILARVTSRLHDAGINIKSVITAQTSINILLSREDLDLSLRMIVDLENSIAEKVTASDNVSLIALVGEGMLDRPGIAARIFNAVSREKINVKIISAGASEVATYFMVDRQDRERTIRAVHREFFKGGK